MLLPLVQPSHCLACPRELLPGVERPDRFCSNQCLLRYHTARYQTGGVVEELAPSETSLHLANLLEKVARVMADTRATVAMRELTDTEVTEQDLDGIRWLSTLLTDDPVMAMMARKTHPGLMRQFANKEKPFASLLRVLRKWLN